MRCFIAIDIPIDIKNKIGNIIEFYQKKYPLPIKWVETENLHITLHFLGEISEELVERIKDFLVKVKNLDYIIDLKDVGKFPENGLPRILWLGFEEKTGNIIKVYKFLYNSILSLNLKVENREFKPHITIGRCKKIGKEDLIEFNKMFIELKEKIKNIKINFESKGVSLYKSELFPKGPIYIKIF